MDYGQIVELAPAYVALVIFVWYTLRLTREHREDAQEREKRWLEAAEKRDEDWREFLEGERTQRREAMTSGTARIEGVVLALDKLAASMQAHETNALARYDRLMEMHSKTAERLDRMEQARIVALAEMAEGIREFTALAHVHEDGP